MYLDMILAGRRSNYLDEEDPAQDDSHSPARVPSLQAVYFWQAARRSHR